MNIYIMREGLRIFKRHLRIKRRGYEKFTGNDEEICRNIISRCWNGKYFQVSPDSGNYPLFYSRDFGMCCDALIKLGYTNEVLSTLSYAMQRYSGSGYIALIISREGIPFNFPDVYSPDGTAYLLRSLRMAGDISLIVKNRGFLNKEIMNFEEVVIDKDIGFIKDKNFSGMRDHAVVRRSCYDMIAACMLSDEIERINLLTGRELLSNLLKKYKLRNTLVKNYWKDYFMNSASDPSVTSHCNIFPYYLDVIDDMDMLIRSMAKIKSEKLDVPFPLKYENYNPRRKFIPEEIFVSGWERNTLWGFLAIPYIDLLSRIDPAGAREQIIEYGKRIEKHGMVEVYFPDGKRPYSSAFFSSETSILWASMYLELKNRLLKGGRD